MITRFFIEGLEIDLNEEFPIDLNFSIADVTDFAKRNTSFSRTIRIPGSSRNKKIFGHIYEIGSANLYDSNFDNVNVNFNPTKRAAGLVYQNNTIVFDGVVRLISIEQKFGDLEFEINLFGRTKDLFFELKEKKLSDLNLDDMRTPFTIVSVVDFLKYKQKWNTDAEIAALQTSTGAFLPNICFPLVDYGFTTDGLDFPLKNFKMAIFLRELWDRIHKQNGFEYDAPFIETEFFKKLILVKGDESLSTTLTPFRNNKKNFASGYLTDAPGFAGYNVEQRLSFDPEYNQVFENLGNGRFKYLPSQEFVGKIKISYDNYIVNSQNCFGGTSIYVNKEGVPPATDSNLAGINFVGFGQNFSITQVNIKQNDVIYAFVRFYGGSSAPDPFFGFPGCTAHLDVVVNGVRFELFTDTRAEYDLIEGGDIDVALSLPKGMKQREFIQLVIQHFNLYVIEDKFQKNKLKYIPYPFYYDYQTKNAVDWTNKIDRSKPTKIVPIGELVAREFKVTYSNDSDAFSEAYRKTWSKEYGESNFVNDNEFELSEKTIKVITGAPVMRQSRGGRKLIHLYKNDAGIKKPGIFKPRIAMFKQGVTCENFTISSVNPYPLSFFPFYIVSFGYPYAGHLDDPNNPTQDILFGRPEAVYFSLTGSATYPNTQIADAFYNDLFQRYSDKDSKVVTAFFNLDAIDIETLDFARLIRIGNNYFILSKIEEYTPNGESLAKVTLIKVSRNLAIQDLFFILQEDGNFLLQENNSSRFYI